MQTNLITPAFGDPRLPARFWAKIQVLENGCWEWTAYRFWHGYAAFRWGGKKGTVVYGHRFAYQMLVGPIPVGLECDHLCRNKGCVNPAHIEPVTRSENMRRVDWPNRHKQQCPWGHPYSEANTYIWHRRRHCRACARRKWHNRHQVLAIVSQ